jgi:hypothetical protein
MDNFYLKYEFLYSNEIVTSQFKYNLIKNKNYCQHKQR